MTEQCFGTLYAGRHREELQPIVGMFVNTLVLRLTGIGAADCSTFRQLAQRAKQTAIEALDNAIAPFDEVVQALREDETSVDCDTHPSRVIQAPVMPPAATHGGRMAPAPCFQTLVTVSEDAAVAGNGLGSQPNQAVDLGPPSSSSPLQLDGNVLRPLPCQKAPLQICGCTCTVDARANPATVTARPCLRLHQGLAQHLLHRVAPQWTSHFNTAQPCSKEPPFPCCRTASSSV